MRKLWYDCVTRYLYHAPPGDNLTTMDTMMQKMTPFMIVRHPFVRLVSAYEDKMLNPHPFPYNYHHKIQETIKKRRRNKQKTINFPKDLLNSKKYQQMLRRKVFKSFPFHQYPYFLWKVISLGDLRKQPSFSEFVDWLIQERRGKGASRKSWMLDKTWVPYHTVCPVCQNTFTVLKLDSERWKIGFKISKYIIDMRFLSGL